MAQSKITNLILIILGILIIFSLFKSDFIRDIISPPKPRYDYFAMFIAGALLMILVFRPNFFKRSRSNRNNKDRTQQSFPISEWIKHDKYHSNNSRPLYSNYFSSIDSCKRKCEEIPDCRKIGYKKLAGGISKCWLSSTKGSPRDDLTTKGYESWERLQVV